MRKPAPDRIPHRPQSGIVGRQFHLESFPDEQSRRQRRRAVHDVFDGATIMVGGFGLCGMPGESDSRTGPQRGTKNLTPSATTSASTASAWACCSPPDRSPSHRHLRRRKQAARRDGPEGHASISIWSRRARSPNAFAPAARAFPRSSLRPALAPWSPKAKRAREFDGRTYVMERALKADFALSKPGRATAGATSSIARPRATSIP